MKKSKTQKGITLVALIITIIVLLILAIVTINSVSDGGIIRHAQNARTEYIEKADEENTTLQNYADIIEANKPNGEGESTGNITPQVAVGVKATENSTINGQAFSSTNPVIPAGFYAINVADTDATDNVDTSSRWSAEGGPEVDKGLVIKDDAGNEFVWVPLTTTPTYILNPGGYREPEVVTGVNPSTTVDSASGAEYDAVEANLTKAGVIDLVQNDGDEEGQIDAYDFKKQLENEFDLMAASIEKYKGFYVGRYEVSISGNTAASKGSTAGTPVYSATNTSGSADNWYGLYALCKKYTNEKVKSTMIWGSQYDAMLTWMGTDATDFDKSKRNTDSQRRTGYVETDVIRNIYDLGGNSYEWTLYASTFYRVFRGGIYSNDYSEPVNLSQDEPTCSTGYSSSRLALYIEV